jgi:hypothetical protein
MNISHRYVDASKFSAAPLAALLLTLIASVALPANAAGGIVASTTVFIFFYATRAEAHASGSINFMTTATY